MRQAPEVLPKPNESEDNKDLLLYRKVEEEEVVVRKKCCADPEQNAIVIRDNPALFPLLFGGAAALFLDQVLRLWPDYREQNLHYFTTAGLLSGNIVGFYIGARNIHSPGSADNLKIKSLAILEGIGNVFPLTMGGIIQVYCKDKDHWKIVNGNNMCTTSNFLLGVEFFLPSIGAGVIYTAWNFIPKETKKIWAEKNTCAYIAVNATEVLLKSLLFSRLFQSFMLAAIPSIPEPLSYEIAPIAGALVITTLQSCNPKHKEKFYTGVLYFMGGVISYLLSRMIKNELTEHNTQDVTPWSYVKIGTLSVVCGAGIILTLKKSTHFIKELQKKISYIPVGNVNVVREEIRLGVLKELDDKGRLLSDVPIETQQTLPSKPSEKKEEKQPSSVLASPLVAENSEPLLFSHQPQRRTQIPPAAAKPVVEEPKPAEKRSCVVM
jgi:hypothetical protein